MNQTLPSSGVENACIVSHANKKCQVAIKAKFSRLNYTLQYQDMHFWK